ncbi:MAG: N-acetylmuramoyl-L-alanine amidase [Candidatus Omnitrophica bacterium]|nr:N-acetylmuramoyl-L-alanine amidase [Candidatus Omnitrophota bacterium]
MPLIGSRHRFLTTALLAFLAASCATTSPTSRPLSSTSYTGPTVLWEGRRYVPLPTLCDSVGVPWEWDRVARVATVYRGSIAYRFLLGSRIYTTNDLPQLLDAPVVLHRDAVLVPESVAASWAPPVARPPTAVAKRPGPMRGAARPPRVTGAPPFRRIVIDAGHGGHDPGATGFGGTREKDVVLDIARRLERQLEGSGMEVVMTRRRDEFVPLPDRIGLANRRQADFFVSIHANANRNRRISGLEVYYLPESAEELRRARDQAQAWPWAASSRAALDDTRSLRTVLWDLVNVESRRTSVLMGMHLCRTLQERLAVRSRGVRGARFVVLRQAMVPSILVEVGYLSNAKEEARLAGATYREAVANALAEGIVSFGQTQARRYAWSDAP